MSNEKEYVVSLKRQLYAESKKKKKFQGLFVGSAVALIIILSIIYNRLVLDYAVIDNVKIQRQGNSREILFQFDVVEPGRLDFNYGKAVLTDTKTAQREMEIRWAWEANGDTVIAIRSRKWLFPHWDDKEFVF